MKKFVLAAAFAGVASTSFAGGMAEVIMPVDDVIMPTEAGSSSSAGLIIPLILLALVAAAVSAD